VFLTVAFPCSRCRATLGAPLRSTGMTGLTSAIGLAGMLLVGCGSSSVARQHSAPARHADEEPHPTIARVPRTIVTPDRATDVEQLFVESERAFAAASWDEAARGFARIAELDPDGPFASRAMFNAGWAHDNAARHRQALSHYEAVARRYPQDALAAEALVRAMRLACHLEDWHRAGEIADIVLANYRNLGSTSLIVTYGSKALALVTGVEPELAAPWVERGRTIVERDGLLRGGEVHRDVAQLYFALGELRRQRGEKIVFDPLPPDFVETLERRCQLLLDAQSAYFDAMRAYDAHWSAMAGFRVGDLYRRLHRDLLAIPRPPAASDERRAALFEGAMRLRYAVLLRKGLTMMEHTLAMAERTGEVSEWVARARAAQEELAAEMRREDGLIDALPYSRRELQAALDALRKKDPPRVRRSR
jgi:tetratricopeptide (TPR) repeat protein